MVRPAAAFITCVYLWASQRDHGHISLPSPRLMENTDPLLALLSPEQPDASILGTLSRACAPRRVTVGWLTAETDNALVERR